MIRPKISRKPIFQGQPHPPYATAKLTKHGYKITQQKDQPQTKTYIQLSAIDKAKLEALANGVSARKNNEQE